MPNSARRVYAVPTSNPVAKIRQSTSYSTPSTTTPCSVTRSTPFPFVSTNFTLGRLKVGRYSSLKVGRLHHCPYQALRASAVCGSFTIEDTRPRTSFIFWKSAISDSAAMASLDSSDCPLPDNRLARSLNRLVHLSLTKSSSTGRPDKIELKL